MKGIGPWPYLRAPVEERVKGFAEVRASYTAEEVVEEARRCLRYPLPACANACPVHTDVPGFMGAWRRATWSSRWRS